MATVSGTQSYLAWAQEATFGTPIAVGSLLTAGNLRTGDVFSIPSNVRPRLSTGGTLAMPSAAASWREYSIVDWSASFEFANAAAWQPLICAAFGQLTLVGFVRTYTPVNPYFRVAGDGTPATYLYNHLLTLRHCFSGSTGWQIIDAAVSQFTLSVGMDSPAIIGFAGKGHKFTAETGTQPTFAEISGAVFPWNKYGMTANAGIYLSDTSNVLNTVGQALPLKRMTFTLDNNIQYEPLMAIAAGSEMRAPTRGSLASAMIQVETLYDTGMTQMDADEIFALFAAGTNVNFRARGWNSATDIIDLDVKNASGILQAPKIAINGDGIVGFTFGVAVMPVSIGDLTLTTTGAA